MSWLSLNYAQLMHTTYHYTSFWLLIVHITPFPMYSWVTSTYDTYFLFLTMPHYTTTKSHSKVTHTNTDTVFLLVMTMHFIYGGKHRSEVKYTQTVQYTWSHFSSTNCKQVSIDGRIALLHFVCTWLIRSDDSWDEG